MRNLSWALGGELGGAMGKEATASKRRICGKREPLAQFGHEYPLLVLYMLLLSHPVSSILVGFICFGTREIEIGERRTLSL